MKFNWNKNLKLIDGKFSQRWAPVLRLSEESSLKILEIQSITQISWHKEFKALPLNNSETPNSSKNFSLNHNLQHLLILLNLALSQCLD